MVLPLESAASASTPPALPFAIADIERLEAPSVDTFVRRHLRPRCPVILTGLTEGWLPRTEWTPERVGARYGDARVVAARLSNGTLLDDPLAGAIFRHVRLREFVASLAGPESASDYVMAPSWNFPAAFQDEYRVPPYCAGATHLRAKLWVGKAGTVTPMHRDVPHNLHVHLAGRKRWLLVPKAHSSRVYPRGLLSGMPNFARVDPEQPDYASHPRFRDATVFGGILDAGDTLFVPHGWWHHTRLLDDAVSMNFFWGGPLIRLASFGSTVFKRARGTHRDEWG